jgi:hypothetical protein
MHKTVLALASVTTAALVVAALAGCTQTSTETPPAQQQIEQNTQQKQQTVDETLNSAKTKVDELVAAVDSLEARINGLGAKSDLTEIQRKLTNAIGEAGDKKVAALNELSAAFATLITKIDTAAAKLPAGGAVRTELEAFSQKLKDAQTAVSDAAASAAASSTPAP